MSYEEWHPDAPSRLLGAPIVAATLGRPQADTTVCTIAGIVNPDTMRVVQDALNEARLDGNAHLVIDLSTVTSMDAAGPYILLEARFKHNISGGGHSAVVVDPNSQAIPELHVVALKATFDFHCNLADALRACASASRNRGRRQSNSRHAARL